MGRALDVQSVIDRQPGVRRQLPLLILGTIIMFVDGFDIFMLGKIAPAVASGFGEPATRLTIVFLCQQVGLTIGSFVISPLSDRFGRKTMLLWCAAIFGLFALATVAAQSLVQVAVLQGIAGLFLAGVIPNATTLLTEYAPPSRRATFVSIAFTGYTAGGAAGAFVIIWLLKDYGWQSGFWIGGIVPLLFVPLFLFLSHESLQFRARRNPQDPKIERTLRWLEPGISLDGVTEYTVGPGTQKPARRGVASIFTQGRAPLTLLLWCAYFLALGTITLLASWMATFFNVRGGISLERYAAFSLLSYVGGLAGTTTVGFLMDRFRPVRLLMILFVIDAIAIAMLGMVPFGSPVFVLLLIIWGYCQAGGQGGINALCAQAYPTEIRSTGVGWAFGLGRMGGIFAPTLGGFALARQFSLQECFILVAVLPLLVTATLFGIGRMLKQGKFGK